ncbi:MFS transporter [Jeotgalibacillus sp. ET6]|uniref:MFS transporter n=1 Tax=Jeotgalibacillus sp. ET6 TaxID=3037260 RepID=UPI0024183031|nr:MFS transporter [Jeotgalibacillus sp. ET6]MDG5471551.1 MFS transporter [Jeotgalibacillus sp. ET6]
MKNQPHTVDGAVYQAKRAWQMFGLLLLAQVLVALVGRGIAPLSPLIASDLRLSNAQVGGLPSALFAGQMLVSIPSGLVVDRIGTKKLLFIVCLLLGIFYAATTLVPSYALLLLCILLGGMAYGTMHPVTNKGILYWFPQRRRGMAMGIKQMGITLGSALAAAALLPFALYTDWKMAVIASCIILFAAGLISSAFYHENVVIDGSKNQQEESLINKIKHMAMNRDLLLISLAAFILNGSQMSLTIYVLFYIGNELLFGLGIAGAMYVLSEIGGSAGRIVWGTVSDSLFKGRRFPVTLILMVVASIGAVSMVLLTPNTPVWILCILLFTLGFAVSGFNGLWMNIATELTEPQRAGLASGFSLTIGSMGVMVLPPLLGWISDITGSFKLSWLVMGGMILLALVFILFLRKRRDF